MWFYRQRPIYMPKPIFSRYWLWHIFAVYRALSQESQPFQVMRGGPHWLRWGFDLHWFWISMMDAFCLG